MNHQSGVAHDNLLKNGRTDLKAPQAKPAIYWHHKCDQLISRQAISMSFLTAVALRAAHPAGTSLAGLAADNELASAGGFDQDQAIAGLCARAKRRFLRWSSGL
jgi:hypothetical protein